MSLLKQFTYKKLPSIRSLDFLQHTLTPHTTTGYLRLELFRARSGSDRRRQVD